MTLNEMHEIAKRADEASKYPHQYRYEAELTAISDYLKIAQPNQFMLLLDAVIVLEKALESNAMTTYHAKLARQAIAKATGESK